MKKHPVIRISHTIHYVHQPEGIGPAVFERRGLVLTIVGKDYVSDKILSHRKRGKRFQFLTLMKGGPYQDTVR